MANTFWNGRWRGSTPQGDTHVRARKVISPSGGIVRGKFPSRKNGRMVQYEGLLELDAIYLFETSPQVVRYREQPLTIFYPDGDCVRRYTPDFELCLLSGEIILVEIKHSHSLQNPELQLKFELINAQMSRSGDTFVLLNEIEIREEPRLLNLRWIYHQAAHVMPTDKKLQGVINRVGNHFPISIKNAKDLLRNFDVDPFSMLLTRGLHCPIDVVINYETLINLTTEVTYDWFCVAKKYGF